MQVLQSKVLNLIYGGGPNAGYEKFGEQIFSNFFLFALLNSPEMAILMMNPAAPHLSDGSKEAMMLREEMASAKRIAATELVSFVFNPSFAEIAGLIDAVVALFNDIGATVEYYMKKRN